jgi:hypothetical protein
VDDTGIDVDAFSLYRCGPHRLSGPGGDDDPVGSDSLSKLPKTVVWSCLCGTKGRFARCLQLDATCNKCGGRFTTAVPESMRRIRRQGGNRKK